MVFKFPYSLFRTVEILGGIALFFYGKLDEFQPVKTQYFEMLKTMMNINSYKKREDDECKREMVVVFSHRQIVEAKSGYCKCKINIQN